MSVLFHRPGGLFRLELGLKLLGDRWALLALRTLAGAGDVRRVAAATAKLELEVVVSRRIGLRHLREEIPERVSYPRDRGHVVLDVLAERRGSLGDFVRLLLDHRFDVRHAGVPIGRNPAPMEHERVFADSADHLHESAQNGALSLNFFDELLDLGR